MTAEEEEEEEEEEEPSSIQSKAMNEVDAGALTCVIFFFYGSDRQDSSRQAHILKKSVDSDIVSVVLLEH